MILQLQFFLRVAVELFGPRKSLNAEWPAKKTFGEISGTSEAWNKGIHLIGVFPFLYTFFRLKNFPRSGKEGRGRQEPRQETCSRRLVFLYFVFFIFFATRLWRLLVGGCTRICFIFAGCFVAGDAATKIQLAAQKVLQMRAENLINVDTSWGQNWTELNLVLAEDGRKKKAGLIEESHCVHEYSGKNCT